MLEQIKASAGSGKTYTLTRRFLARLRDASPDAASPACAVGGGIPLTPRGDGTLPPYSLAGILAATFTNKAAAEMQARVIRELKLRALAPQDAPAGPDCPLTPPQARRWVAALLRRYDSLNIRTIDSLLTLLVRLNALSLDLPPDFAPVFSLEETLAPLYDVLLDQAAQGDAGMEKVLRDACRSLLLHNRVSGFQAGRALRSRLLEVVFLAAHAPLPPPETAESTRAILAAMHRDLTQSAAALRALAREEGLILQTNAAKFLENCAACPPLKMPPDSAFGKKAELDELLVKTSRGRASADAAYAFADMTTAYAAFALHGSALLDALEIMPFVALARPLVRGLETLQREEGLVPAMRLPALALEAVSSGNGVSDSFCRLGDSLVHLLFDDFQDTSTDQWRSILPLAVDCLSRGGSLTYVGDVKQAIYGWRGGNAELFDAVAEDPELTAMLENGPRKSGLPCNWRSAAPVVVFNNSVFGRLADPDQAAAVLAAMLPAGTPARHIAEARRIVTAAFAGCEQTVADANAAKPGLVRLTRVSAPSGPEIPEAVRERMRALLVDDLLRRRPPGDIAILVRKNDDATEIAGWLSEWRIPAVTEYSFCLEQHPLIARLTDVLSFLDYPLDDLAFWSAVSGPELFESVGGPGPEELAEWLASVRAEENGPPLFMAYRRDFPAVWAATLGPFLDQAGLMSAYDTVLELVRAFRIPEFAPEQVPFIRRFAEVAHAAENKGFSSLSSFLEFWAESGRTERVPMPESMDAVRICSIHKAKGLEFPVVIVPYHHQRERADSPLIRTETLGLPLVVRRARALGDPYHEHLTRRAGEQLNLLYVAWTRPTEELHAFITAAAQPAAASALAKGLAVLLRDLPFTDDVYESGTVPPSSIAGTRSSPLPAGRGSDRSATRRNAAEECGQNQAPDAPRGAARRSRAPAAAQHAERPMSWLPRLKIFRTPAEDRGFSERRRGLLAHACLEALRHGGDAARDADHAVRHAMRAFPLSLPDPDAIRRDLAGMLAWYASLPETRDWMRYGSPEQPLLDADGDMHRVDLLVDKPDCPLLAVEYKTGQPGEEHRTQVARYLRLLASAMPGRAVRGVIVYLDGRTLVPVPGPEHDAPFEGEVRP